MKRRIARTIAIALSASLILCLLFGVDIRNTLIFVGGMAALALILVAPWQKQKEAD